MDKSEGGEMNNQTYHLLRVIFLQIMRNFKLKLPKKHEISSLLMVEFVNLGFII